MDHRTVVMRWGSRYASDEEIPTEEKGTPGKNGGMRNGNLGAAIRRGSVGLREGAGGGKRS